MDLILIYAINDDIDVFSSLFKKVNLKVIPLLISDNWENDKFFFKTIRKNEFFLIITTSKNYNEKWFKFVAGYCIGRGCSVYLYNPDKDLEIRGNMSMFHSGSNLDEIEVFFKIEYQKYLRKNEISNIKSELEKKGLYLTPYHFFKSIEDGNCEDIELFIKAGISVDLKNENDVSAFCAAVRKNRNKIAELLLNNNCDIYSISGDNGNNSLMDAAAGGNYKIAEILIGRGIDINVKSKNEQTALMLAVGRNDEKLVELLLKSSAETEAADVLDMTAKKYAEILKYKGILNLFKKYGK